MRFGQAVLSHPLIVEAIESDFVPMLVYNNRRGRDAELLKQFGEPAWNNPVVRFLDARRRDLLPRKDGVWKLGPVATRMVAALEKAGCAIPPWLGLLAHEARAGRAEIATLVVGDLDRAEARFGGIDAVVEVLTGTIGEQGVIELRFDAGMLDYAGLLRQALQGGDVEAVLTHDAGQQAVAAAVAGDRARPSGGSLQPQPRDRRWHDLRKTPLRYLPLTDLQLLRVNAALAAGSDPAMYLSPRQRQLLHRVREKVAAAPDALSGAAGPDSTKDLASRLAELERLL